MMPPFPIDAVIAWVDGNDPVHRQKRMKYTVKGVTDLANVGSEQRFVQFGEIRYCVASILRYAPYIRKIFIVTDGQDPHLDAFLDEEFPSRTTEVEIVDHSVLFEGHEDLLPVFNCRSLECVFWRIPSLSEHFIYFNDDFMLCRPCPPEIFFDASGRGICYARKFSVPLAKLIRVYKRWKRHGKRASGFKDGMLTSAIQAGSRWSFPYIGHIPSPLKKSVVEKYFASHPEALLKNMSYKFRDPDQFNPQVLNYILGLRSGDYVMRSRRGLDILVTHRVKPGYIEGKLSYADTHPRVKFCCFNALEKASQEQREMIREWLTTPR